MSDSGHEQPHGKCGPEDHDRSLPDRSRAYDEPRDPDGCLSDAQVRAADGLLGCNDCGLPLFWCRRDNQYHHVDPRASCPLAGAWSDTQL